VPFFEHRGYQLRPDGEHVWDVARDLRDYASPAAVQACDAVISPAQPGEEEALLAFLWREFPAGWHWEFQEFLREHGRLSDYVLLRTGRGVEGFCQTTFEDSLRPLDRFFPHRLPRPWGQLGPIGVSRDARGLGYGAALLDAGLCLLRERGVAGCVIDWTGLLAFYGKFGFEPYRRYAMLVKTQP